MTTSEQAQSTPLWLSVEEKFLGLDAQSLSGDSLEAAIQKVAGELDEMGYNVSGHGGNMLQLRWAMADMKGVGRPMMKDVNDATSALTLEDVATPFAATDKLIQDIGGVWPKIKKSECRVEVVRLVEETRLNLLIAKAKEMSPKGGTPDGAGDEGIRYLLGEKVEADVIISSLEITQEKLDGVIAAIKAEKAEIARVETLLEKVDGKSDEEKVIFLLENNVAEALILEMAKVGQGAIDGAKKAMEEELKEKQRLAEEEAARKKKEAEGPSLDDIPKDELIDLIDSVREILEFSDVEKEIRVMCEQSAIPKALVDIAVSDPDKLDELEKAAEG
jgi:hypothetical protein